MNTSSEVDSNHAAPAERSLGARFRAAREARGLAITDAAAALRAPARIVTAIEADDVDSIGAPVFARGYLSSYARLLGLPQAVVDVALAQRVEAPQPLHSSMQVSRSRVVGERLARKGAYLVLTVSLVAPFVYYATQDQLPVHELGLRSLDAPMEPVANSDATMAPADAGFDDDALLVAVDDAQADARMGERQRSADLAGDGAPAVREPASDVPASERDVTVMASMAPFSRRSGAASSGWVLSVQEDSWVEVVDADGRRLEFGLVRGGSERRYPGDRVASVAVGNARGVRLERGGEPVDLAPFQRANVARFTVSSDGRLRPAGS
jgi:cytoskeleton protein RodZ